MSAYRDNEQPQRPWVSESTKEQIAWVMTVALVVGGVCFLGFEVRSCAVEQYAYRAGAGYRACVEACDGHNQ